MRSISRMPDHVFSDLVAGRIRVFENPVSVAASVLRSPLSVHRDFKSSDCVYILADGDMLRAKGLLMSRTAPYVDAVLELRSIHGKTLPRMFHLSPRKRNRGGDQLWP